MSLHGSNFLAVLYVQKRKSHVSSVGLVIITVTVSIGDKYFWTQIRKLRNLLLYCFFIY